MALPRPEFMHAWQRYDGIAADYDRLFLPEIAEPVRDLVALLGPSPGDTALDLGTGTGAAALALASAVGPEGRVIGLDASVRMLSQARRKGVRAIAGEANRLPLRPGCANCATASFVLSHLAEPEATVAGVWRVLGPGGRMAATAWSRQSESPGKLWREAVTRVVGAADLERAIGDSLPSEDLLGNPDALRDVFVRGGMRDVRVVEQAYEFVVPVETFVERRARAACGRFVRERLDDATWAVFVDRALDEYRERFGDSVPFTDRVLIAIGSKAGAAAR